MSFGTAIGGSSLIGGSALAAQDTVGLLRHRLFAVSRFPGRLLVVDTASGKIVQKLPAAGDCDDIFWDAGRKRFYASGGEGAIFVFEQQDPDHYKELARISTGKERALVFSLRT